MKKTIVLLTTIIVLVVFTKAQAPQGLNYQAVAYNAGGTPLVNQAISVRLSILDGSATGTTVYQETQNPTTDNTGLFSIVIGNGVVVAGTFAAINWGNGSKWLKTEIDITGGTSYLVMGTSQFLSVPYALYAEKSGSSTSSFQVPDGFETSTPIVILGLSNYTVPAGKNLYFSSAETGITIDGVRLVAGISAIGPSFSKCFVGISANSVVNVEDTTRIGFLVDKKFEWKTFNLANSSFTVPVGKKFVIVSQCYYIAYMTNPPTTASCRFTLNGVPFRGSLDNIVLNEGDVLSTIGCPVLPELNININGYLKDK